MRSTYREPEFRCAWCEMQGRQLEEQRRVELTGGVHRHHDRQADARTHEQHTDEHSLQAVAISPPRDSSSISSTSITTTPMSERVSE